MNPIVDFLILKINKHLHHLYHSILRSVNRLRAFFWMQYWEELRAIEHSVCLLISRIVIEVLGHCLLHSLIFLLNKSAQLSFGHGINLENFLFREPLASLETLPIKLNEKHPMSLLYYKRMKRLYADSKNRWQFKFLLLGLNFMLNI